jgi:hypothetical protein
VQGFGGNTWSKDTPPPLKTQALVEGQ